MLEKFIRKTSFVEPPFIVGLPLMSQGLSSMRLCVADRGVKFSIQIPSRHFGQHDLNASPERLPIFRRRYRDFMLPFKDNIVDCHAAVAISVSEGYQ